jgi:hypothetical protein
MSQSVIDMNEALPRDVYSNEKVAALVNKTRAHYAARATEFREQMAEERKKQAVQVVTTQWRGIVLISVGFLLQLIGVFR